MARRRAKVTTGTRVKRKRRKRSRFKLSPAVRRAKKTEFRRLMADGYSQAKAFGIVYSRK